MTHSTTLRFEPGIHPTAHVDESATVHESAHVGAGAFVGPNCVVGADSRIHARAVIWFNTKLGEGNEVHPCAVLGGDPQDRAYDPENPGALEVGDRNIFRENATVNRSTHPGPHTVVGDDNFLMASAHLGHNVRIGDRNILSNTACVAGHGHLGSGCVLSGAALIHQFCTVGDGVMFQGLSAISQHVPPFVIVPGKNMISGLNRVGIRRNPDISSEDAAQIKDAYRAVYRDNKATGLATVAAEQLASRKWLPKAKQFLEFFTTNASPEDARRNRGFCGTRDHKRG